MSDNTLVVWLFVLIIVVVVLFRGDPDIVDSLRALLVKWVG